MDKGGIGANCKTLARTWRCTAGKAHDEVGFIAGKMAVAVGIGAEQFCGPNVDGNGAGGIRRARI